MKVKAKSKSAAAKALSFITRSAPPDAGDDVRQVAPTTALAAHNAAHPEVRELRESAIAKFLDLFNQMSEGLGDALHGLILKAETARQAAIYLIEFAETLPGKRITPDFYEQCKDLFRDGRGQVIDYWTITNLMSYAQKHPDPIETPKAALECSQLLFRVSGEPAFQLTGEPPVLKTRIPPKDELGRVTEFIEKPDLDEFVNSWAALKLNPNYCPGGHLRPDLRDTIVHEWKPRLERLYPVLAEIRAELGI